MTAGRQFHARKSWLSIRNPQSAIAWYAYVMLRLTLLTLLLATPALAAPKSNTSNDPSGPRAALLMYDKLVGPKESEKALPLYYATNTRERALAAVFARLDGALANLRKKAADKFGQEPADTLIRTVNATTAEDINNAKIQVNGDTASVLFPNSENPNMMIRVNGEWKLSVKAVFKDLRGAPKDFRTALSKLTTACNQIAAKIEQGQYSSVEQPTKDLGEAYKKAFASTSEE
jgi:hypothetical protein